MDNPYSPPQTTSNSAPPRASVKPGVLAKAWSVLLAAGVALFVLTLVVLIVERQQPMDREDYAAALICAATVVSWSCAARAFWFGLRRGWWFVVTPFLVFVALAVLLGGLEGAGWVEPLHE